MVASVTPQGFLIYLPKVCAADVGVRDDEEDEFDLYSHTERTGLIHAFSLAHESIPA